MIELHFAQFFEIFHPTVTVSRKLRVICEMRDWMKNFKKLSKM